MNVTQHCSSATSILFHGVTIGAWLAFQFPSTLILFEVLNAFQDTCKIFDCF